MDSLTHLLVGHAMGAVAGSAGYGEAAYWAALVGNSLPDIDVPISLIFRRDIKMHRTVTHTLPGCILLAAVAALAISQFVPGSSVATTFVWTLLGCLAHLGMDCLNLFGARPFWPLNGRSIDLGVLHIWDPVMLLLLGVPSVAAMTGKASLSVVAVAFFLIWPYIVYRLTLARKLFRKLTEAEGTLRARVIPGAASWGFVTETDTVIQFGRWQHGRPAVVESIAKEDSPLIRASKTHPAVASFLETAEYPYARIEEDETGNWVVWGDVVRRLRADFRPLRVRV